MRRSALVLTLVLLASSLPARTTPSPLSTSYLPNCADCTRTTPCDTECGYDPGKGGPVTCGEYGICLGWP
ncbi:MAG TPA: hypothetical protein VF789_22570 [Thermoanaerobaculia bacterium]